MMLTPEGQNSKARDTDVARLEQHLKDLSVQYLQGCTQTSPREGKYAAMAKLYAGATRLHQAVQEGAVADAIVEIGSNLIGCEQMALMIARNKGKRIALLGSVGLNRKRLSLMQTKAWAIIDQASTDSIYMTSDGEDPDPFLSSLGITAVAPFWLDYTTKGAIFFFDLLPQRNGLDWTDRELLTLLRAYAGPCLSTGEGKDQETFE